MTFSSHPHRNAGGNGSQLPGDDPDKSSFGRRANSGARGHTPQLSISDPSHYVTEVISGLYGSEDEDTPSDRPLSFMPSASEEIIHAVSGPPSPLRPKGGNMSNIPSRLSTASLSPTSAAAQQSGPTSPLRSPTSPALASPKSLRDFRDQENLQQPNDIAQELSNLQALRRMSMDVGNSSDPDLLPFNTVSLVQMSSVAPTGDDDEGDPSRLLWVPARVHPELAPGEFKTFIEDRVRTIKRRSGDSSLSVDSLGGFSGEGLQRKKSMLSRHVESSSSSIHSLEESDESARERAYSGGSIPLDDLVNDVPGTLKKLSLDSEPADGDPGDRPVLAKGPGRMGLQRSTRTQYRKGNSVRGDRSALAKRVASRHQEGSPTTDSGTPPPVPGLQRSNTEPGPVTDNFSRPKLRQRLADDTSVIPEEDVLETRTARSTSLESGPPVPQIVATSSEDQLAYQQQQQLSPQQQATSPGQWSVRSAEEQQTSQWSSIGARASELAQTQNQPQQPMSPPGRDGAPLSRAQSLQNSKYSQPQQSPQPLQGQPYDQAPPTEESRRDKKSKKDEDSASVTSTRSAGSGWKWFKSGSSSSPDDKDREKKSESKKHKSKQSTSEKYTVPIENARLDVLQSSIDGGGRGGSRESSVLDREDPNNRVAIDEKDKKHARGKSDARKDGLFSSIFGGKKKADRDSMASNGGGKKGHHLKVSVDEYAYKPLRPDIDYPWSRFPLVEERAIYRMAHLKLAHPRRPLHSQVLLSNFMYNYLAIVQAMNPTMQVPLSPQQRRLEEERKKKEAEQQALMMQQQQQQQQQQGGEEPGYYDYAQVSGGGEQQHNWL